MHPEVLKLISKILTEMAEKDLGFQVLFEWPVNPDPGTTKMTVNILTGRTLTVDERRRLEDWAREKLGAEWRPTIWERLMNEPV